MFSVTLPSMPEVMIQPSTPSITLPPMPEIMIQPSPPQASGPQTLGQGLKKSSHPLATTRKPNAPGVNTGGNLISSQKESVSKTEGSALPKFSSPADGDLHAWLR